MSKTSPSLITISDLCKRQDEHGYEYVSLIRHNKNNEYLLENPKPDTNRPEGIYFSKIIKNKTRSKSKSKSKKDTKTDTPSKSMSETTTTQEYTSEWYNHVKSNFPESSIREYEQADILFAKFNLSKLKNLNEFNHLKKLDRFGNNRYDWDEISKQCCGVIIDDIETIEADGWDIYQIIIWNSDAINEYEYYDNSKRELLTYKNTPNKKFVIKNKDLLVIFGEKLKELQNLFDFIKKSE